MAARETVALLERVRTPLATPVISLSSSDERGIKP